MKPMRGMNEGRMAGRILQNSFPCFISFMTSCWNPRISPRSEFQQEDVKPMKNMIGKKERQGESCIPSCPSSASCLLVKFPV
jgi:hypothetical protein